MAFLEPILVQAIAQPEAEAIIWRDRAIPYRWLLAEVEAWKARLRDHQVAPGAAVSLEGDFSPTGVAALLALIDSGAIVAPLATAAGAQRKRFSEIAEIEFAVDCVRGTEPSIAATGRRAGHPLIEELRARRHPGLILFSSGSTGESKGAVHDFVPLLGKFAVPRSSRRMLSFLLFDHIGGVNTLLYSISNAGTLITTTDRSPEAVCRAIERFRVEVLPATPTFLHLLLLSEAHNRHDLSSLRLVTYGTEVMPETTLQRFRETFPDLDLQQTYGLSELGILRSKSRSPDSLWVRLGGEGYETRVREGLLEIRAASAMIGYLNAPSPFTEDGWFQTGDAVLTDGEYFRILGRRSELINVGGEKVYPAEVEAVLQTMPGVEEVAVFAERNLITGQMVVARVKLSSGETLADFRRRMRQFCKGRLEAFKIPQKVLLDDSSLHSERFKKVRR